MKLLVLTLFSVTLATAAVIDRAKDGVTDESGYRYGTYETRNPYGIYETNYRGNYQNVPQPYVERKQYETPKVVEEVAYYPNGYNREGYEQPEVRYPYEYYRFGREGLGFDQRTAYALGLRYPITPQILKTVYRPYYHDNRYELKL